MNIVGCIKYKWARLIVFVRHVLLPELSKEVMNLWPVFFSRMAQFHKMSEYDDDVYMYLIVQRTREFCCFVLYIIKLLY